MHEDAECARLVQRVEKWRALGLTAAIFLAVNLGIAMAAVGSVVVNHPVMGRWLSIDPGSAKEWIVYLVGIVLIACVCLWVSMYPYCWLMRFAIKRYRSTLRCPGCTYSLIGLAAEDGATTCPECGKRIVLAEHVLRAEDLLSIAVDRPAACAARL